MSEKPRLRVTTTGWIRHDGSEWPTPLLRGDVPVRILVRSGNAEFMQGFHARDYAWPHRGFSGDILFWRPA